MRRAAAVAGLLGLAVAAAAQERPAFETPPPAALPDVSGWESDGASMTLDDPGRTVEYELSVSPERQGVWAVTRYRTLLDDRASAPAGAGDERLQWNDGHRFRRWVCRSRPEGGCRWRELEEGSAEYQEELASVLLIWRMHRRLLYARAHSLLPND